MKGYFLQKPPGKIISGKSFANRGKFSWLFLYFSDKKQKNTLDYTSHVCYTIVSVISI